MKRSFLLLLSVILGVPALQGAVKTAASVSSSTSTTSGHNVALSAMSDEMYAAVFKYCKQLFHPKSLSPQLREKYDTAVAYYNWRRSTSNSIIMFGEDKIKVLGLDRPQVGLAECFAACFATQKMITDDRQQIENFVREGDMLFSALPEIDIFLQDVSPYLSPLEIFAQANTRAMFQNKQQYFVKCMRAAHEKYQAAKSVNNSSSDPRRQVLTELDFDLDERKLNKKTSNAKKKANKKKNKQLANSSSSTSNTVVPEEPSAPKAALAQVIPVVAAISVKKAAAKQASQASVSSSLSDAEVLQRALSQAVMVLRLKIRDVNVEQKTTQADRNQANDLVAVRNRLRNHLSNREPGYQIPMGKVSELLKMSSKGIALTPQSFAADCELSADNIEMLLGSETEPYKAFKAFLAELQGYLEFIPKNNDPVKKGEERKNSGPAASKSRAKKNRSTSSSSSSTAVGVDSEEGKEPHVANATPIPVVSAKSLPFEWSAAKCACWKEVLLRLGQEDVEGFQKKAISLTEKQIEEVVRNLESTVQQLESCYSSGDTAGCQRLLGVKIFKGISFQACMNVFEKFMDAGEGQEARADFAQYVQPLLKRYQDYLA